MNTYKLRADGFGELRQKILLKTTPVLVLSVLVGMGMSYANSGESEHEIVVLLITILLCLGATGFGIYNSLKQQQRLFASYTLTISDRAIMREQDNTPTVIIPVTEVRAICQNADNTFTIKGNTALDFIGVPAQIEEYAQVEQALQAIHPLVVTSREPFVQKLRLPVVVLTLGALATVYLATNKLLVGVSGVALSGFLLWSFFLIQRHQSVDRQTKKWNYLTLLVAASILLTTYYKVLGT